MILVNFGHPFTEKQRHTLMKLSGQNIDREIYQPAKFNHTLGFEDQVIKLVDSAGLTAEQWQTEKIVINPPSYNAITVTLLAELHGRMGYFPSVVRLSPIPGANPPEFDVSEILHLQHIRDQARNLRK